MYVDDRWTPVQGGELQGFLDKIDPVDGKYKVDASSTTVSWRNVPFYESKVALIRVEDPNWSNRKLKVYYLTLEGELFRLNGMSGPIHDINAKAPIKITDDNVLDYLRFFCFFVRGDEGPFLISEDIEDPYMPEYMKDETRTAIANSLRPASFEGKDEKGHWMCDAIVFYSNALFLANFSVQPGGMIEMLNDEPVLQDLPVRVDAPIE